jgi:hypothetical protein
MQVAPVGVGFVLAVLVLVLSVVFIFIGVPDPRVPLGLIGLLAICRLL